MSPPPKRDHRLEQEYANTFQLWDEPIKFTSPVATKHAEVEGKEKRNRESSLDGKSLGDSTNGSMVGEERYDPSPTTPNRQPPTSELLLENFIDLTVSPVRVLQRPRGVPLYTSKYPRTALTPIKSRAGSKQSKQGTTISKPLHPYFVQSSQPSISQPNDPRPLSPNIFPSSQETTSSSSSRRTTSSTNTSAYSTLPPPPMKTQPRFARYYATSSSSSSSSILSRNIPTPSSSGRTEYESFASQGSRLSLGSKSSFQDIHGGSQKDVTSERLSIGIRDARSSTGSNSKLSQSSSSSSSPPPPPPSASAQTSKFASSLSGAIWKPRSPSPVSSRSGSTSPAEFNGVPQVGYRSDLMENQSSVNSKGNGNGNGNQSLKGIYPNTKVIVKGQKSKFNSTGVASTIQPIVPVKPIKPAFVIRPGPGLPTPASPSAKPPIFDSKIYRQLYTSSSSQPISKIATRKPSTVYTTCEEEANDLIACLKGDVFAFDLEWPVVFGRKGVRQVEQKTALVQISDGELILLIQVSKMKGLPSGLVEFCKDKDKYKLGVSIRNDGQKLTRDFNLQTNGLIELTHLARQADPQGTEGAGSFIALAKQTEMYLGYTLPKGSVRTSNWSATLDRGQQEYAANDVYSTMLIYQRLKELALERCIPFDLSSHSINLSTELALTQKHLPNGLTGSVAKGGKPAGGSIGTTSEGIKPSETRAFVLFSMGKSLLEIGRTMRTYDDPLKTNTIQHYLCNVLQKSTSPLSYDKPRMLKYLSQGDMTFKSIQYKNLLQELEKEIQLLETSRSVTGGEESG